MNTFPTPNTKLGVHYFPDTLHYREMDLRAWLPELDALGVGWITLCTPTQRAIPETFLNGLISAQIQPILHFNLPAAPLPPDEIKPLLQVYADWGVKYVSFFDRPNMRRSWPTDGWIRTELVERFLDIYLPVLEHTLEAGLIAVLPPLEPGGDYWDTAFLRAMLHGILRRAQHLDLDRVALGAYGWVDGKPIAWGAGGPERWPGARPYFTPVGEEDQRGFHIFDWYSAIARAILGNTPPVLLLGAGGQNPYQYESVENQEDQSLQEIVKWIAGQESSTPDALYQNSPYVSTPDSLLACSLWLLAAAPGSESAARAWYRPDGTTAQVVADLKALQESTPRHLRKNPYNKQAQNYAKHPSPLGSHPLAHYLLLPPDGKTTMEDTFGALRELVDEHQPTIGFSVRDACLARMVTVLGGPETFPEEHLELLRAAGCQVVRMQAIGTELA